MFKIFDSGRRKVGCLALVVACAFTAAWVRSSYKGDYLALAIGRTKVAILSQQGSISSALFSPRSDGQPVDLKSGWWTVTLPAKELQFVHYPTALPYVSFVFALLLLAAWLLLVKPQSPIAKLPPIGSKPSGSSKRPKRRSKGSR